MTDAIFYMWQTSGKCSGMCMRVITFINWRWLSPSHLPSRENPEGISLSMQKSSWDKHTWTPSYLANLTIHVSGSFCMHIYWNTVMLMIMEQIWGYECRLAYIFPSTFQQLVSSSKNSILNWVMKLYDFPLYLPIFFYSLV